MFGVEPHTLPQQGDHTVEVLVQVVDLGGPPVERGFAGDDGQRGCGLELTRGFDSATSLLENAGKRPSCLRGAGQHGEGLAHRLLGFVEPASVALRAGERETAAFVTGREPHRELQVLDGLRVAADRAVSRPENTVDLRRVPVHRGR